MAKKLQLRRGTTTQHGSFTGAEGEVTIDTTKDTAVVHDGSQAGGRPLAREDMSNVSSASIAGRLGTDSIAVGKIAGGTLPSDVKVNNNNIIDLSIANADVSSSAAIAGTKISPDFGSQNIATTGTASTGQIIAKGTQEPQLIVQDSDTGHTGNSAENGISFRDGGGTQQGAIGFSNSGDQDLYVDTSGSGNRINFRVGGSTTQLEITSGTIEVTGNIGVSGTVDGVDIAAKTNLFDHLTSTNGVLANGVVATTQSAGDNSTKVATTAYTDTAITNLVDSSPSALNTLNELAAAINDDASFATTVTNNLATKVPLSGGTMTGDLTVNSHINLPDQTSGQGKIKFGAGNDLQIYHDGTNNIIHASNGYLQTRASAHYLNNEDSSNNFIRCETVSSNDLVSLHFNGSKKFETTSGGATVTGTCTATAFAGDGSALTGIVSFVSGMIIIWSGAQNAIPSGWVLCNGSNSTPDLRDRFVVGAGNSYSVGATGGSNTATDTVSISGSDTVNISGSDTVNINVSVSGTTGYDSGAGNGNSYSHAGHGSMKRHNHSFSGSGSGSDTVTISGSDTVTISDTDTVSIDTRSPYYALCYIMKT